MEYLSSTRFSSVSPRPSLLFYQQQQQQQNSSSSSNNNNNRSAANSTECLSASQVAAFQKIYDGPRNSTGHSLYPGFTFGSENELIQQTSGSLFNSFTALILQNVVFNDLSYDVNSDPAPSACSPLARALARARAARVARRAAIIVAVARARARARARAHALALAEGYHLARLRRATARAARALADANADADAA
ncbi:hypothetical protein INS49_006580 [Diaporthe citri]|uniref:uncharacterized protein n=1 Tax=Diaporthe citri TaxID=83186 RepID=UPI001C81699D|nr:uncharacterized protein INS49_006580 [Diaporthe citri]KAG6364975.1 hypothetical protein INS49_006580 [Diaporthe citri]